MIVVPSADLKLLRKMLAWGIPERLLTATAFKVAGENVIRLDPESPREQWLTSEEAERKLFEAASHTFAASSTAMLEPVADSSHADDAGSVVHAEQVTAFG